MIAKNTIAAGLIALTTLTAVPANASGLTVEFGFGGPATAGATMDGGRGDAAITGARHRLSTDEVRWILRDAATATSASSTTAAPSIRCAPASTAAASSWSSAPAAARFSRATASDRHG